MNVLKVDTSTSIASTSLFFNGASFSKDNCNPNSHIEELDIQIKTLLEEAGARMEDIGLLVVGTGPGSFTGLRIGYAYVAGLSSAMKIPVVKSETFRAYAARHNQSAYVCALADARRGEVFAQFFMNDSSEGGQIRKLSGIDIVKLDEIEQKFRSVLIDHKLPEAQSVYCGDLQSQVLSDIICKPSDIAQYLELPEFLPAFSPLLLQSLAPDYLRPVAALKISERVQRPFVAG